MFTIELQNIKDSILALIPIYSDGVVIKHGTEQSIKGITDTIDNYFYIDVPEGDELMEMSFAEDVSFKGAHNVTGDFELISRTCGYDLATVANALLAALIPKSLQVTGISTDPEYIFKEETGEDIQKDMDLVYIRFSLTKDIAPLKKCIDILCKSESC